jgi:hypothetical protein
MVAVGIAIYLRVRRHFGGKTSEAETLMPTEAPVPDQEAAHLTGASEESNHGQSSDRDTRNAE